MSTGYFFQTVGLQTSRFIGKAVHLKNQIKNAFATDAERVATVTVIADWLTEFENHWTDLNSLSPHSEAIVYARLVDRLKA